MNSVVEAFEKAFVKLRRKRVSRDLFRKYQGIVQRGPFCGLSLDGEANISQGPLALKIFGLYEQVVIDQILKMGPFVDMINIGAADGYFSLGMLKANLAKRSICFEMTTSGRAAIRRNAQRNGVADRVVVLGKAGSDIAQQLAPMGFQPTGALVLCDIEGAEFEVLTVDFLQMLAGAALIVELHDRIQSGKADRRDALIANLPPESTWFIIKSVPPSWSGIDDIEALSDNDRALATSEGRRAIGEWLVVTPSNKSFGQTPAQIQAEYPSCCTRN